MANIKTRIITKHADLDAWSSSSLTLLEGEIVLGKVLVPQPDGTVAPTFVAKVGNGDTFANSPWLFAKASDVYSWAKKEKLALSDLPEITLDSAAAAKIKGAIDANSTALESYKTTNDAAVKSLGERVDGIVTDLSGYTTDDELAAVEQKADDNAANIAIIMGAATQDGSIAKALADAKSYADTQVAGEKSRAEGVEASLNTRLETAEGKLTTIQGAGEGSINKAFNDAKDYTDTEVAKANGAAAAAKTAADNAQSYAEGVAGNLASETAARETADATNLQNAKDYADAQDTALHTTISKEIDDDVDAAKTALQANIDKKVSLTDYDAKMTLLENADTELSGRVDDVEAMLENVSNVMDFRGAVEAVPADGTSDYQKGDVVVVTSGDDVGKEFVYDGAKWHEFGYADDNAAAISELQQDVLALEGKVDVDKVSTAISSAVGTEKTRAEGAEATLQSNIDTLSGTVTANKNAYDQYVESNNTKVNGIDTRLGTAENEIDVLQTKMEAVETVAARADAASSANTTAISNEVTARGEADAELSGRIDTIENDYLKAADKTELTNAINGKVDKSAYDTKISALETADTNEAKARADADTAMDNRIKVLESIDHTKYAQASDLTALTGRVTTAEGEIDTLQTDLDAIEANYLKVTNGAITDQSGVEIIFDCGGAE